MNATRRRTAEQDGTARCLDSAAPVCGIVGQASGDGRPADPATLVRMCAALEHRGPDSRGLHVGSRRRPRHPAPARHRPGHRRPADLQRGRLRRGRPQRRDLQLPRAARAPRACRAPLRHAQRHRGHRPPLRGRGPGLRAISCTGCSALAVWDGRRRRLLLARDRVGKKPLYYAERDGALSFASELAALLQDDRIPRDVDHQALDAFLALPLGAGAHDRVSRESASCRPAARSSSRTDARRSRAIGG